MSFASRLLLLCLVLLPALSSAASIWHVEGEQEFYLFGTIHVLKPDTYPLPEVYQRTFDQCDALWLEADLKAMEQPSLAAEAQQMMMMPAGQMMSATLSDSSLQAMRRLAAEANVPLAAIEGLKPWAAANVLTIMIFQQRGFEVEKGLDVYLQNLAIEKDLPVHTFETILWQLQMFDDMSARYSDDFMEFSTNDMDNIDQLVADMIRAWQQGDVVALYEQADFTEYRQVERIMLSDRNSKWMDTLLNLNGFGTQCVAVGALHMAADHGLLARFEQAGYKVTRLDK